MELLYAPWRSKYIKDKSNDKCPFCEQLSIDEDDKHFILKRFKHCAVILNLHPYNAGHLLVIPFTHTKYLYLLNSQEQAELMHISAACSKILQDCFNCEGLNFGLNHGEVAGGTIPDHLHLHILPRWQGDTNFLAALANTKAISFDLREIYKKLLPFFNDLKL